MYSVILADPPWHYKNYASEAGTTHSRARGAQKHYPTEKLETLCAMPIEELSADRCALFMWATWPLIEDAFTLIRAWGFSYKTLAWEWVKLNSNNMGIFIGMGNYTRSNSEPCLLAFRGEPLPVAVNDVTSVIMSPVQQHSRKPSVQYDRIEALYPAARKLELFARRRRAGWDVFGNQVAGSISLPPSNNRLQPTCPAADVDNNS